MSLIRIYSFVFVVGIRIERNHSIWIYVVITNQLPPCLNTFIEILMTREQQEWVWQTERLSDAKVETFLHRFLSGQREIYSTVKSSFRQQRNIWGGWDHRLQVFGMSTEFLCTHDSYTSYIRYARLGTERTESEWLFNVKETLTSLRSRRMGYQASIYEERINTGGRRHRRWQSSSTAPSGPLQ